MPRVRFVFPALLGCLLLGSVLGPVAQARAQTVTLSDPDPLAAARFTTTDSTFTLRGDLTGIQADGVTEGPVWRVEWGVEHKGYSTEPLPWGVPVAVWGVTGSEFHYQIELPTGIGVDTEIILDSIDSGDPDLYVRKGAPPTTTTFDCRSWLAGSSSETCPLAGGSGTYYVMVRGYSTFSGARLLARVDQTPSLEIQRVPIDFDDVTLQPGGIQLAGLEDDVTEFALTIPPGGDFLEVGFYQGCPTLPCDWAELSYGVNAAALPALCDDPSFSGYPDYITFYDGPEPGLYSLTVTGCEDYDDIKLYATWGGPGPLVNGEPLTGLGGAAGENAFYTIQVPEGARDLRIQTTGGTGDVDLRARFEAEPDFSTYDCVSATGTNEETCFIANPQAGTYQLMFRNFLATAGVTLEATWLEGFSVSGYGTGGTIDIADIPAGSRPWTAPGIPLQPGRNVITVRGLSDGGGTPPLAPEPVRVEVWRLPPTDLLQDGMGLEIDGTAITELDSAACPECVSGHRAKLTSALRYEVGSMPDVSIQITEGISPRAIYLLIDDLVVASSSFSNQLVVNDLPLLDYTEGSLHELSVAIEIDDGTGVRLQKLLYEEANSRREVDSIPIQFVGAGFQPGVVDETDRFWQSLSKVHDPAATDLSDVPGFNTPYARDLAVFETPLDPQDPVVPRAWVLTGKPSLNTLGPTPAGVNDEVRFYYDLWSGSGGEKLFYWHEDEWFERSIDPNCALGCISGSVPDPPETGSLVLTAVAPTTNEDWFWLGTNNGLMCARVSTVAGTDLIAEELYRVGDGPAGSWVSDLDVLPDGTLWVGHRGSRWYGFAEDATRRYYEDWGGVSRWSPGAQPCQGGTWTHWRSEQTDDWTWEGVAGFQIASVSAVSSSQVWAASEAGLSFFDGSAWTHETVADGLPFDDVAIVEAGPGPGEVWMTGNPESQSGIAWRRDGTWGQSFVRDPETDFVAEVNDLVLDARGVVWFATPQGVVSFDPETLQRTTHLEAVVELPDATSTGDGCFYDCNGGALFPFADGRMNTALNDGMRTTVSITTAAEPPTLLTPSTDDAISSLTLGIDLAFEPVLFASGYQILMDGSFDPTLNATQTVLIESVAQNGKRVRVLPGMHKWSVRAIYPDGRAGPPSVEVPFGLIDERTETSTGAVLAYQNGSGATRVLDLYRPRGSANWETGVIDPDFEASTGGAMVPLAAGADGRLVSVSTGLVPEQYPTPLRDDVGNRPEVSRVATTSEPEGVIFGDSAAMSITLYNELLGTSLCADALSSRSTQAFASMYSSSGSSIGNFRIS